MEEILLEFKNVTDKNRQSGLHDISFSLKGGYIYGIMGKNGAGKTALINLIFDRNRSYKGRILYRGTDIRQLGKQVFDQIGYVSEDNKFFESLSVYKNCDILSCLYDDFDKDLFSNILESEHINRANEFINMSRGERLKVQIAFALAHKCKVMILDGITAGMDPVYCMGFFNMLRRFICNGEHLVLLTSHNLTEIRRNTDYAAFIENGNLSDFKESIDIDKGII